MNKENREREQQLSVILTKWKIKGMAIAIGENEQRIEERSSCSCKWTKDRE